MAASTQLEARAEILQSIRANLAASAGVVSHHAPPPAVASNRDGATFENEQASRTAMFCERLESVGGHCVIVRDDDGAARSLSRVIADLQTRGAGKRIALSDAALVSALAQEIAAEE